MITTFSMTLIVLTSDQATRLVVPCPGSRGHSGLRADLDDVEGGADDDSGDAREVAGPEVCHPDWLCGIKRYVCNCAWGW